ncbi:MAG: hypothetical protein L3J45_10685 [Flavobacteriaceae bacterium]|nr:hypothetical protein [Flavobacteriaceae bacterium]
MKYILKITLGLLLSLGLYTSCTSSDTPVGINENTIAERLSFVDVNARIANKQNSQSKSLSKIIIVRWDEWGRKKKQCRGWGLCNAVWFPKNKSASSNGGATLLEFDNSLGKYYIDILLATTPPFEIPLDALTLKIDENFELNVQKAISKNLTFNKGDYLYDKSLGEFGGYRIYLD